MNETLRLFVVPETLRLFVDRVVKEEKTGEEVTLERKCINIQQSIIAATRPRSFISPIQLGLSVLLHRVVWPRPASFGEICNSYVTYIKRHYGDKVSIVFDGYAFPGTKDIEHMRRSHP